MSNVQEQIGSIPFLNHYLAVYGDWYNPWFFSVEVGRYIGYSNGSTEDMLLDVSDSDKLYLNVRMTNSVERRWFINESGLLDILLLSRKKTVRDFRSIVKDILLERRRELRQSTEDAWVEYDKRLTVKNTKRSRVDFLTQQISKANDLYYNGKEPHLSDRQYDDYVNELRNLQPTHELLRQVGTSSFSDLNEGEPARIKHEFLLTSLKSTKDIKEIDKWQEGRDAVLSHKLDGITLILTYEHGTLLHVATRGNGEEGVDVTSQALKLSGVPYNIPYEHHISVMGECVCSYESFEIVRASEEGKHYRNPRNMAAGCVMSENTPEWILNNISFVVWGGRIDSDCPWEITYSDNLALLGQLGFNIVEHISVQPPRMIASAIADMSDALNDYSEYPCDGLVIRIDNTIKEELAGDYTKYPPYARAFKWPDPLYQTHVTGMEWSVSDTGLVTPIVHYQPVEIEGTTCQKANLHSLKCFEEFQIGIGDILEVYKSNKIIPTVESNLTRSGKEIPPSRCPKCGGELSVYQSPITRQLICKSCKER